MDKIGVLGAGTWGIALARLLANKGDEVTVWSALPAEIDELNATKKHKNLPGMMIPVSIKFTKDIKEACEDKEIIVFAVPSVFVRGTAKSAAPYIKDQVLVDVAKVIEASTLFSMTQVISDELSKNGVNTKKIVALSGPTHAEEVSRDLPTTIVAACADEEIAKLVQDAFMTSRFRVYTNTDIAGVELCGAMKNIIALASGILTGVGYGDNTRAALITRGMTEITRLGLAMGCSAHTFYGLAGIGDLIVTATSKFSRNNTCGYLIGTGKKPEDAIKEVGMVVEGINALPAAIKLAEKYGVDMPIVFTVNEIVKNNISPNDAAVMLMTRDKKSEDI